MGILDRKSTDEVVDVPREHDCTCKSNKGRDINCKITEHSG